MQSAVSKIIFIIVGNKSEIYKESVGEISVGEISVGINLRMQILQFDAHNLI
jgi:hypothetical protein